MSQISDPSLDSLRPGEDWTAFMDMNFEGEAGMKCIRKSKFTRKIDICSTFVVHFWQFVIRHFSRQKLCQDEETGERLTESRDWKGLTKLTR